MITGASTIILDNRQIPFTLRRHPRSRTIRLSIHRDGRVVVSAPPRASLKLVEAFVTSKISWIISKLDYFSSLPKSRVPKLSRAEIMRYKVLAKRLAHERLQYFNRFYGFTYHSISIRNQKTRWGSCSKTGRINFNYKIVLLPPELADYVVVHELCHLGAFNHSQKFWDLVDRTIPNHRALRKQLRTIGL